jgi:RNA polymerase sigma-70 factor (ECF subfamily)
VDPDAPLVERWRAGDTTARDQLFDRHYGAIATFFRGKVGDAFGDLTQETFKTCLEVERGFRGHSTFRTYLFGIAWNKLREFIRSRDHRFDFELSSISEIPALVTSPSSKLEKTRRIRQVLEAMTKLPIKQQILLESHYTLDLDADELSEVFAQPAGTIRTQLSRARDAAREQHERLFPRGALDEPTLIRVLSDLRPRSPVHRTPNPRNERRPQGTT